MAQPDSRPLFRIGLTGKAPFEMQSIHGPAERLPHLFTSPVEKAKAADIASYKLESYAYEYTGRTARRS